MQKRIVRRNVALGLMFVMLCSIIPFAFAEIDVDEVSADIERLENDLDRISAGTTPGDAFYGLDVALDNLRYQMASDKESAGLKIAEERLEELKQLSREGRVEEAEEARKLHEETVALIKARVEEQLQEGDDEQALAKSARVNKILSLQEAELEDLRDRLANLSPEQKLAIVNFLLGSEASLGKYRIELENAESEALIHYESKLGKTRTEIREDLYRLREEKRLSAEMLDDMSVVTVEYRFKHWGESADGITVPRLAQKTLEAVKTTYEEAEAQTRIHDGSDEGDDETKVLVEDLEDAEDEQVLLTTANAVKITGYAVADFGVATDGSACVEPEVPACGDGFILEDYYDEAACKQYKCVEEVSCTDPVVPTCDAGTVLDDYRDAAGCKKFKCVTPEEPVVCAEKPVCDGNTELHKVGWEGECPVYECQEPVVCAEKPLCTDEQVLHKIGFEGECPIYECKVWERECEEPVIPDCAAGFKLEDYRTTTGCRMLKCIPTSDDHDTDFIERLKKRLRFDVKIKQDDHGMEAEVHFKMRFVSGTTPEEIYADIVEMTHALTVEQLKAIANIDEEHRDGDVDREIEIVVEKRTDGSAVTEVEVEWDGMKKEFRFEEGRREVIIQRLAEELGVSVEQVGFAIKKFDVKMKDESDDDGGVSGSDDDSGMDDDSSSGSDDDDDNSGSSGSGSDDGSDGSGSDNSGSGSGSSN